MIKEITQPGPLVSLLRAFRSEYSSMQLKP